MSRWLDAEDRSALGAFALLLLAVVIIVVVLAAAGGLAVAVFQEARAISWAS